jgi:dTDP-4-dehydrorhamnose reductase
VKILVFGAGGQVGRELLRVPAPAGIERVGLTHGEVDIADAAAVARAVAAHRPDTIINAAAYTAVDAAEDDRQTAFAINADGAKNVAAAAADADASIVHLSTDYVFNGRASTPYLETAEIDPESVYGASKALGESHVREQTDRHTIVRTSWVFGHHGRNFVKTILRLLDDRDRLEIIDDQTGCPTEAADLATALIATAEHAPKRDAFGTYHFCGLEPTNWYRFALEIAQLKGQFRPVTTAIVPTTTAQYGQKAKRPAYSVLDCSSISRKLGIEVPTWRAGLQRVVSHWMVSEEC